MSWADQVIATLHSKAPAIAPAKGASWGDAVADAVKSNAVPDIAPDEFLMQRLKPPMQASKGGTFYLDLGQGSIPTPTAVPGEFGEPEAPLSVQAEDKKEHDAETAAWKKVGDVGALGLTPPPAPKGFWQHISRSVLNTDEAQKYYAGLAAQQIREAGGPQSDLAARAGRPPEFDAESHGSNAALASFMAGAVPQAADVALSPINLAFGAYGGAQSALAKGAGTAAAAARTAMEEAQAIKDAGGSSLEVAASLQKARQLQQTAQVLGRRYAVARIGGYLAGAGYAPGQAQEAFGKGKTLPERVEGGAGLLLSIAPFLAPSIRDTLASHAVEAYKQAGGPVTGAEKIPQFGDEVAEAVKNTTLQTERLPEAKPESVPKTEQPPTEPEEAPKGQPTPEKPTEETPEPYVGPERRVQTSEPPTGIERRSTAPAPGTVERAARIDDLRELAANQEASDEERQYAKDALADMEAHPEEVAAPAPGKEVDIAQQRAELAPRMTQEEAEAESATRHAPMVSSEVPLTPEGAEEESPSITPSHLESPSAEEVPVITAKQGTKAYDAQVKKARGALENAKYRLSNTEETLRDVNARGYDAVHDHFADQIAGMTDEEFEQGGGEEGLVETAKQRLQEDADASRSEVNRLSFALGVPVSPPATAEARPNQTEEGLRPMQQEEASLVREAPIEPETQTTANDAKFEDAGKTSQQIVTSKGKVGVQAYTHEAIPGLAVTKAPDGKDEWSITHTRSGQSVRVRGAVDSKGRPVSGFYHSPKAAFSDMKKLAPVVDWTKDLSKASLGARVIISDRIRDVLSGKVVAPIDTQPEERTLPAEGRAGAANEPTRTEPSRAEGLPGALGERGESSLETVPPETVRGTSEERGTGPSGEESGTADLGRSAEHGERGVRLPERVGSSEGKVPVSAERERPERTEPQPGQISSGQQGVNDYRITDQDKIGSGGSRAKYRGNVSAIRTLKQVELEGRLATPEEQSQLVKYVGWGGMPQAFDEKNAKWSAEYRELRDLLNEEEYAAARASTPNAHYTSQLVIEGIWSGLRRMGFTGGKMLEPAAGVGHFIGLMPPEVAAKSQKIAIELDSITGRILRQLYQSADVRVQGFEKFNGRDGQFDIIVGNVPFGDYPVHDPEYNKFKLPVHNYFIVKSLDKLRTGGIAALITSSHTMDAVEPKARKLFADRADLLGAIRLPNTAFKGNAGTEVTTDILFLRKRAGAQTGELRESLGLAPMPRFEKLDTLPNGIKINEYFYAHPEMMMGTMEPLGSMYRPDEPTLVAPRGQNLEAELEKSVSRLPENALLPREVPASTTQEATIESIPEFAEVKQHGLKVKKDKVYRRMGDGLELEKDYPASMVRPLKGMLGMRDAVRELFQAEGNDRPEKEQTDLRRRLNHLYDDFIKQNGILHSLRNEKAMRHDPDLPLVLALENYDPRTKVAKKSDIFTKPTVAPRRPVEHVESAKDAMLVSLADFGRLDFPHMEKLSGRTAEELQSELRADGLVFHNPEGHWETTDSYLSGNVRKKLREARVAAKINSEFEQNVKALEQVQPEDLPPSKIFVRLGSSWVPKDVIKNFVGHIFGSPDWGRRTEIQHVSTMGLWSVDIPYGAAYNVNATVKWGTKRANAGYLIGKALNLQEPVIYDKGEDNKPVVNQKETLAAQEKLEELQEEFRRWVFQESPHAQKLADFYNQNFNAEVERVWDGSHLTLPGSAVGMTLRPHQKNQIWRNINGGNQLVAHEVGTGKSYIFVGTAMEMRRLGIARKPLVTVPNNIVKQVSEDFRRMYPESNVLMADEKSFDADNRKEFASRIATGDWDAVVMAHSQFGLLGVSDSTFNEFANHQIQAAQAMMEEVAAQEGKKGPTVKQIEKEIKRWKARIEKRASREIKDNTINFETLGIDALLVDEAHYFKRLWFPTKMGRVPGIPTSDSNRAMDMYLKSRYVSQLNNGKNVIFLTGTPISNTMAEMYVMMKYLDEPYLEANGMEHFDSWAGNFGQKVTKLEVRPENPNKMRQHTRFAKFVNVPELSRMFRRTADVKTVEDLGLPRPKLQGGKPQIVVAEPSEEVLNYVEALSRRADSIRGRRVEKGGDNMLKITTDGRKAGTDYRLIDPSATDDPNSKLNQAVNRIANLYHDRQEQRSTQLVMLDMGVPNADAEKQGRFNLYADIKKKLVARGIPANEVKFIQDAKNDAQKQAMFDDMNDGNLRVLIGSTPLVGVGVNVQKRLYAIHHIDAPMRPADVEQRNGRILRQGNTNPEVHEFRYVTERTFDTYIWQLLENKARFIAQVMKGHSPAREMEDADDFALSAAEVKALASGNPLIMQKVEVDTQLQRLYRLASAHADQQFDNKSRLARIPEELEWTKKAADDYHEDAKTRDAQKTEKFSMAVGKKTFEERKDAGVALNEAIKGNAGGNPMRIGKFAGFDIYVRGNLDGYLQGQRQYPFHMNDENPAGTVQSIEAKLRGIEDSATEREARVKSLEQEAKDRRAELGKPFAKQKELNELQAKKEEIDKKLEVAKRDVGAETAEEDDKEPNPQAGFATVDSLLFGLLSLYNRIMRAWKQSRTVEPPKKVPEPERATPEEPNEPRGEDTDVFGFRLDKLESYEQTADYIRSQAKKYKTVINRQRRGRLSDKELQDRVNKIAEKWGPDAAEIVATWPRGRTMNEAEEMAAVGILQGEALKIKKAQQKLAKMADGTEKDIARLEALKLHNRYVAIHAATMGARAEGGRAVRAWRNIYRVLQQNEKTNYQKVVDALGGRELTDEETNKLLAIKPEDHLGYYKFLRDHTKFSSPKMVTYYWMNNILSSPHTILRKMMGDAIVAGLSLPKNFLRAGIAPLFGDEYGARDAFMQTKAFFGAFPEGMKRAAFVLGHGIDLEHATELNMPLRPELKGGYWTNWPIRNLAGVTTLFRTMHFQSTLAAIAVREARANAKNPKDIAENAAQLFDSPSPDMMSEAAEEAEKLALISKPGSFLRKVLSLRNAKIDKNWPVVGGYAPLWFEMPFAQVPSNIVKFGLEYSPLGALRLLRKDVRSGEVPEEPEGSEQKRPSEKSDIVAKALLGTLLMAAFASWAAQGNITGAAPSGEAKKEAFYNSGKQPWSMRVPLTKQWIGYPQVVTVLAPVMAALAAWHDAYVENGKKPSEKQISQMGQAAGAALLQVPFLRGISDFIDGLTNPRQGGFGRSVANLVSGFIPGSSLLRTTARSLDPMVRDPQNLYDRIRAGLPVLSKQVPAKIDALGREQRYEGEEGVKAFLPSPVSTQTPKSKIDAELSRLQDLGMSPIGKPQSFVTYDKHRFDMTQQELRKYQIARGQEVYRYLDAMFSSDSYKQATDQERIEALEKGIRMIEDRGPAKDEILREIVARKYHLPLSQVPHPYLAEARP